MDIYINLFIYYVICFLISCIMIGLSYLLISTQSDSNKLKSYECGYQNFGVVYNQYEIHYYKTSILFLIFDIELVFLIPGNLSLFILNFTGFCFFIIFIIFLIYTLIFEYYNHVLDWSI